ncbi:PRC-barrel domain-containing protein [Sphingosinicella rhizophila]|uniref:PRC-barrel domain-containing protein n=1 Tax=Sphingosinicella rhizophila TaxID=3050082 RepID=A0ABU3QB91_9SPHN|nr:PRC-barrel domain-containing protein [Sphingosinicella sp. GR2756]MDT9600646.1 PRC-barrel domain-containing protein [Sphingosinicella sp. GR2756]
MQDSTTMSRTDSPNRLIASNRVEGTAVYNRAGEKLGRVEYFMVDKQSGKADYAVMSFGGLFGLGEDHYPLPWDVLDYDADQGGYIVDLDKEKLTGGPRYRANETPEYDRTYGQQVYGYYGIAYPW